MVKIVIDNYLAVTVLKDFHKRLPSVHYNSVHDNNHLYSLRQEEKCRS